MTSSAVADESIAMGGYDNSTAILSDGDDYTHHDELNFDMYDDVLLNRTPTEWDVNTVSRHFSCLPWVPQQVVTLLAANRLDGPSISYLTEDDLMDTFCSMDREFNKRFLEYVYTLFGHPDEDEEEEEEEEEEEGTEGAVEPDVDEERTKTNDDADRASAADSPPASPKSGASSTASPRSRKNKKKSAAARIEVDGDAPDAERLHALKVFSCAWEEDDLERKLRQAGEGNKVVLRATKERVKYRRRLCPCDSAGTESRGTRRELDAKLKQCYEASSARTPIFVLLNNEAAPIDEEDITADYTDYVVAMSEADKEAFAMMGPEEAEEHRANRRVAYLNEIREACERKAVDEYREVVSGIHRLYREIMDAHQSGRNNVVVDNTGVDQEAELRKRRRKSLEAMGLDRAGKQQQKGATAKVAPGVLTKKLSGWGGNEFVCTSGVEIIAQAGRPAQGSSTAPSGTATPSTIEADSQLGAAETGMLENVVEAVGEITGLETTNNEASAGANGELTAVVENPTKSDETFLTGSNAFRARKDKTNLVYLKQDEFMSTHGRYNHHVVEKGRWAVFDADFFVSTGECKDPRRRQTQLRRCHTVLHTTNERMLHPLGRLWVVSRKRSITCFDQQQQESCVVLDCEGRVVFNP